MLDTRDYRDALRTHFEERRSKSRTSLRAYARGLGLSPSTVHELFGKKTNLSRPRLRETLTILGLSPGLRKHCLLTFDLVHAVGEKRRIALEERIVANRQAFEAFEVSREHLPDLMNWETLAIHEYLCTSAGKISAASLAGKLGFDATAAERALETLVRLGYLRRSAERGYERTRKRVVARSPVDHEAFKRIHREAWLRAGEALEAQDAKTRYSATDLLAVDPEAVPELRRLTEEYLDRVQSIAARSREKSALYALSLSLFRLDRSRSSDAQA